VPIDRLPQRRDEKAVIAARVGSRSGAHREPSGTVGLEPFQERYRRIVSDPGYVEGVLREGAGRVEPVAGATVRLTKERMGLWS